MDYKKIENSTVVQNICESLQNDGCVNVFHRFCEENKIEIPENYEDSECTILVFEMDDEYCVIGLEFYNEYWMTDAQENNLEEILKEILEDVCNF